LLGDRGQIVNVVFQTIEKNKIVTRAVHLGKLQIHNLERLIL
jgi:hypothetical protein